MTEPPAPGTPLESLMILVWRARQDIELQKTRSMVQAVLAAASEAEEANNQLKESWQDFLDGLYPYQRGSRKRADDAAMEYLKREVAKGPLTVTPLQPIGRTRSKLKTQYYKREDDASAAVSRMRVRKDRRDRTPG